MKDIQMPIEWQEGRGESVEIGYLNPNGQQCCGHCGVKGTDHGQYVLGCFDACKNYLREYGEFV